MQNLLVVFGLFLLLAGCDQLNGGYNDTEIASIQEKSCGFIQNSKGYRVSWHSQVPVTFYLEKSFPEEWRAEVERAAEDWNRVTGKQLMVIAPDRVTSSKTSNDRLNVIYWITTAGTFQIQEQAKTSARWTGNILTDTDILINAKDWTFFSELKDGAFGVHMESLMVHELGHALGLVHQSILESVMFPTLKNNTIRDEPPRSPDLADLECEYL